ncbi:hypothetical protein P4O66_010018, partial [Electrophorus voltai]
GLRITQQDLNMEDSVHMLEVKELLQQKEEELEACKRELEMLVFKLQEKDSMVQQFRVTLQSKEQELSETKKYREKAEEELQGRTRELECTTEQLRRMTGLLQGRLTDLETMGRAANKREEHINNMAGELQICKRQLATLGLKLQEENSRTQELGVTLQEKERELEEVKKQQEQRVARFLAANRGRPGEAVMSDGPVATELLDECNGSDEVPTERHQNPKDQMGAIVRWIHERREERREQEEAETTEILEKEFLDFFMARKGLLEGEQENIVAAATRMAVLEKALDSADTAERRDELDAQLRKALERCREAQGKVELLTKEIEQQKSEIEQRHTHEIQKIREKYEIVSRLEAEMNLLQIILPDVQAYLRRTSAETRGTFDRPMVKETWEICEAAGERESPAPRGKTDGVEEEDNVTEQMLGDQAEDGLTEEESATEMLVVKEQGAETGREKGRSAIGMLEQEHPQTQANSELDRKLDKRDLKNQGTDSESEVTEPEELPEIVNGVVTGHKEIQALIGVEDEEEGREVREVVEETCEEDINGEDYNE